MEPIEIVEEFGQADVRLEDVRCVYGVDLAEAFRSGDWSRIVEIAAAEERRLDRAA